MSTMNAVDIAFTPNAEFRFALLHVLERSIENEKYVTYTYKDKKLHENAQAIKSSIENIIEIYDTQWTQDVTILLTRVREDVKKELTYLQKCITEQSATIKRLQYEIEELLKQNATLKENNTLLDSKVTSLTSRNTSL